MTPTNLKVLRILVKHYDEYEGGYCLPFAPIMRSTKLTRSVVRRACRALARAELAEFEKGLWSEYSGRPAGAGYRATRKGVEFAAEAKRMIDQEVRRGRKAGVE